MEQQPPSSPKESQENPGKELIALLKEKYPPGIILSFNSPGSQAEQSQQTNPEIIMFREKATPDGSWYLVTEKGFYEVGKVSLDPRNPNSKLTTDEKNLQELFANPDKYPKAHLLPHEKSFTVPMPGELDTEKKLVLEVRNNGKPLEDDSMPRKALENSIEKFESGKKAKEALANMLTRLEQPSQAQASPEAQQPPPPAKLPPSYFVGFVNPPHPNVPKK